MNVVPLIDVIFCLLLFFMCSFHFKRLEGSMDAWLPRDKGPNSNPGVITPPLEEMRVVLGVDPITHEVVRTFGRTAYPHDGELGRVLRARLDRSTRAGAEPPPLILESAAGVPWENVFRVMDLAKEQGCPRIEFALASREIDIPDPSPK